VSDATGNYTFRNLMPGTYDLATTLTGFKELKQTAMAVTAGNPRRVDLKLELGGMAETVEVIAETTLIKTEKADLSTELVEGITTLPLNQPQLQAFGPGPRPPDHGTERGDRLAGRSLRVRRRRNGIAPA
jgi:hypothetical protein